MKYLIAALVLIFCSVKSAFADTVKVDFIFDMSSTANNARKNALVWTEDKHKTEDFCDAISGASVQFSTKIVAASYFPESIKKLVLFAVSPPQNAKTDALTAEKNTDGSIDITFVHRGIAYWISSDTRGIVDAQNGCSTAIICDRIDGIFCIKDEFVQENADNTNMQNVNWDAVEFDDDSAKEKNGYTLKKSKIKITLDGSLLRLRAVFSWKKLRNT